MSEGQASDGYRLHINAYLRRTSGHMLYRARFVSGPWSGRQGRTSYKILKSQQQHCKRRHPF
jgi:hypothetical protein